MPEIPYGTPVVPMTPDGIGRRGEELARSGLYSGHNGATYAEDWEPPDDDNDCIPNTPHQLEDEPEATTWEPFDLGPYLRGEIEHHQPSIGLCRSDGQRFIYPGREHAILGETESGKTWLALACVAAEIANGNRVVYIHFEESDPGSTIERLLLLGVSGSDIATYLMFVAPAKPVRSGWMDTLLQSRPTLVVLDGINEGMSLHGADIMAADGASTFRRLLVMPCLRAGAATVACDHLPKNAEGRGRDAYGSVHKGNAIDGARFVIENTQPFGRGLRGVSNVFVTKDRPGQLRAHGQATKQPGKTFFGTLAVDDGPTSGPDFLSFYAPRDDDREIGNAVSNFADTIHGVIDALPGGAVASMRLLCAEVRKAGYEMRDSAVRSAADDLIVEGRLVEVPGKRGARGYKTQAKPSQQNGAPK